MEKAFKILAIVHFALVIISGLAMSVTWAMTRYRILGNYKIWIWATVAALVVAVFYLTIYAILNAIRRK